MTACVRDGPTSPHEFWASATRSAPMQARTAVNKGMRVPTPSVITAMICAGAFACACGSSSSEQRGAGGEGGGKTSTGGASAGTPDQPSDGGSTAAGGSGAPGGSGGNG